jgi:hypothetical protein
MIFNKVKLNSRLVEIFIIIFLVLFTASTCTVAYLFYSQRKLVSNINNQASILGGILEGKLPQVKMEDNTFVPVMSLILKKLSDLSPAPASPFGSLPSPSVSPELSPEPIPEPGPEVLPE